jgi:uncharacterized protein (TIGR03067 family)
VWAYAPSAACVLWCAVSIWLLLPSAQAQTAMRADLVPLQGSWTVIAAEQAGKPFDAMKGGRLTIGEDSFELQAAGYEARGKFGIRSNAAPKQIDFHLTTGTIWGGIYAVTAKTLRLHYVEVVGGVQRPRLFATSADQPGVVLTLQRN